MPLVAVIIPTFNRAAVLERAVSSVLSQTFRDFELVIINDGSTDETENLSLLKIPDPRLRVISLPENHGVSFARNAGVRATTANWIAFLDSDDEWLPKKLERQISWVTSNPAIGICQTKEIWIRDGKRVNPPRTHEKTGGDIFARSLERCMITPSSVMLSRELFNAAGGFDESLPACEDFDLWLKITCGHPVGLVDHYLLKRYGGHDDQLSSRYPILDIFRIESIKKIIASKVLSPEQELLARKSLIKRAAIVAGGFRKRGNHSEYERYQEMIRHEQ
ncbi:MAG: glycosyltransferase [Chitinispirillaceae bacterium]|jgi:glycosyltransferase involved in cell wall biosynthesis|nr:glycosyltransferase [Chitinispirillaceae bacterium]